MFLVSACASSSFPVGTPYITCTRIKMNIRKKYQQQSTFCSIHHMTTIKTRACWAEESVSEQCVSHRRCCDAML